MFLVRFKKILIIIFVISVCLYFFQLYRVAKNYSQSHRFGDEDAHMLGGHLILKGYKPYKDFSGNHQPLTYIFPAGIQKIAPANTLFPFVGRHRLAVYAYSILWQVVFLLAFGPIIFLFTLIFETLKYVLLGNKVLGEVWALYPFIFLLGISIKKTIFERKIHSLELLFFSVSTFLVTFSLFPLWPSVFILNVYMLIYNRKSRDKLLLQIAPFIVLTFGLFFFIPFKDYFQNTIIDNITFVVPKMNKISYNTDILKKILLPFALFYSKPNLINITTLFFVNFYGILIYISIKLKKIVPLVAIITALFISNARTINLNFGDFHILPWLASFLFIPIATLGFLREVKKPKIVKQIYKISFILITVFSLWITVINRVDFYGNIVFDLKNDLSREHYINYSKSVKNGLGIKSIKKNGDRIFGIANDTLAIWVADGDLALPPLESQRWQYELTRFKKQIEDVFNKNPPEFFLMDSLAPLDGSDDVSKIVVNSLNKNYIQIKHLGKPSELYVLKSKFSEVADKQWDEFKYYLFEKPNL